MHGGLHAADEAGVHAHRAGGMRIVHYNAGPTVHFVQML